MAIAQKYIVRTDNDLHATELIEEREKIKTELEFLKKLKRVIESDYLIIGSTRFESSTLHSASAFANECNICSREVKINSLSVFTRGISQAFYATENYPEYNTSITMRTQSSKEEYMISFLERSIKLVNDTIQRVDKKYPEMFKI